MTGLWVYVVAGVTSQAVAVKWVVGLAEWVGSFAGLGGHVQVEAFETLRAGCAGAGLAVWVSGVGNCALAGIYLVALVALDALSFLVVGFAEGIYWDAFIV